MKRKSESNSIKSFAFSVITGSGVAIAITLIGVVLGTSLLNKGVLDTQLESVLTFLVWSISSLIGTFVSGIKNRDKFWMAIPATVAGYIFVLIALKIAFFEGPMIGIGKGIIAIMIGTAVSFILMCIKPKDKKGKIRYHFK